MRLLKYEDDGRLTITSFDDGAIPPYAILSHTWGADADEVTFADLDLEKAAASTSLVTRRCLLSSQPNRCSQVLRDVYK